MDTTEKITIFAVNKYFIYEGSYDCLSLKVKQTLRLLILILVLAMKEYCVNLIFLSYQELFSFHRRKRSSSKFSVMLTYYISSDQLLL